MSSSVKKITAQPPERQKKSTGPRSKAGKNRVRMNALTHAIYADPKNLLGEDPQQISELVKSVRESLQPQGPLEEAVVNQIISILQQLRRIDRAYDVRLARLINEKAVSRARHRLTQLWEGAARRDPSLTKTYNIKQEVEDHDAVKHPQVQASDFDRTLDDTISDEWEVSVTGNVDGRKRQLIHDLAYDRALLQDVQAARQPTMVILPRGSEGDQTSVGNQIEGPQRLALELYNNGSDKNVCVGKNGQDQVTIWPQARVTIRRFAAGLESAGSFLRNKAKKYRESNVCYRFTDAITRHFPQGHTPNLVAGITSQNQTVEGSKREG